jgi:hypothetical protein
MDIDFLLRIYMVELNAANEGSDINQLSDTLYKETLRYSLTVNQSQLFAKRWMLAN